MADIDYDKVASDYAGNHGLERMEDDLGAGPIKYTSRYLLLWGAKND